MSPFKRRFLEVLKRTVNPLALRLARSGRAPFAIVRHVGRRSGREYETPIMVAPIAGGFAAELTYGREVSWYRNVLAAGGCTLVVDGRAHHIVGVTDLDREAGLRAYGPPRSWVLRLLRRRDFLVLQTEG